jgi:LPS-assembly protein
VRLSIFSLASFGLAVLGCTAVCAQQNTLEADHLQGRPDVEAVATGNVDFRQGSKRIQADRLVYRQATDHADATGNVTLTSNGNWFSGPELQLGVGNLEGFFLNPTYFIGKTQAGGSAQRWDFLGPNRSSATLATYTSCTPQNQGDPDWLLSADHVDLDFETNTGIAKGAVLRFYGVPILAAPVVSFPLSDDRKSGWLPFGASTDNKGGFQLVLPYYWNIAPNRDAKISPIVSARRGLGLEGEFRYLEAAFDGKLLAHSMPKDAVFGSSRGSVLFMHQGVLPTSTRYNARLVRASDGDYWKDFSRNLISTTPRLLDAGFDITHDGTYGTGSWTTYARSKRWQVLQSMDASTAQIDAPYDRMLQLGVRNTQALGFGVQLGLEGEVNRFVNPDGYRLITPVGSLLPTLERPTGVRTHAISALSWPVRTPGWTLVPKLSVNWAQYDLDHPLLSGPHTGQSSLHRTIPSFSLDNAWTFERETPWFGHQVRQTLEPRMFYVHTPYRAQVGLPTFDTTDKDFNVDSIYTDNAFSGIDRISDAHQLTTGVTTKLLNLQTGAESARLGIAQRFLFKSQRITPGDGPTTTQSASDVLLFGSSNLSRRWYLDAAVQHSFQFARTVRSTVAARYSPGPYRTISMAYRLKRGETEQVDVAGQWPLYKPRSESGAQCRGAWYAAGRVNYSLRESRVTDSVLALEYDSSCWVGRVMAKRQSTGLSQATTVFGLEIEFVGLSRLSFLNSPRKVLRDNVPGYLPLRKDAPDATP